MLKRAASFAAIAALLLAGCGGNDSDDDAGSSSDASAATGEPIKIGAVATFSGPLIFPEASNAANAVFDEVNKAGGINGRPIEYVTEDDTATNEGAAAAAKKLVEEEKVLALVGGGSINDCLTNAKYYKEQNILALGGVSACGTDASNFASMNTGPFLGLLMTMSYMIEEMDVQNLCFLGLNTGVTPVFLDVFKPLWEETTGHSLKSVITVEPQEDMTGAATKAKQDGCDGVMLAMNEPDYLAYGQIAAAQGLNDGSILYAMLTSGYSLNVLDKLGKNGEGWITNSEFLPYTEDASDSEELADFKRLMKDTKQTETSFAQGGYLAAKAFVEVLKSVEGEYTRESVTAAIEAMNYETEFLGNPAKWVPYEGPNQLNTTSKIVQIKDGKFTTISDWVQWPPKS